MENLPKKVRSKKLNSKVDLTAMVSVSFLLIIFFMVVRELAKPKAMDFALPDKEGGCGGSRGCIDTSRLYTNLLDENDKIVTYSGLLPYNDEVPKRSEYGRNGIRKEIYIHKKSVDKRMISVGKPKNSVIVIIKPTKNSNFKNLIDILDEMKINNIDTYAIVDQFTPEEEKLLASN